MKYILLAWIKENEDHKTQKKVYYFAFNRIKYQLKKK